MDDRTAKFLKRVDVFLSRTGMSEMTFGQKAVMNPRIIGKLRNGGRCWPEQIDRAQVFMRNFPVKEFKPRPRNQQHKSHGVPKSG